MVAVAVLGAGAVGALGSVASGVIGAGAAQSAAQTQAAAAEQASQNQLNEFNQVQQTLSPFVQYGTSATGALANALGLPSGRTATGVPGLSFGSLTQPFQPTMAQLAQTPGYQFALQQGQLGVQNSFAAQGLGTSGAALKGAANYAQGLASTTYQQQFQNYLAQNQQIYNMLSGSVNTGANAAAMTGQLGTQNTIAANNYLTAAGAAQAAGTVGSANAITGAIGSGTNSIGNAGLLLALQNGGLFGNANTSATISGTPG